MLSSPPGAAARRGGRARCSAGAAPTRSCASASAMEQVPFRHLVGAGGAAGVAGGRGAGGSRGLATGGRLDQHRRAGEHARRLRPPARARGAARRRRQRVPRAEAEPRDPVGDVPLPDARACAGRGHDDGRVRGLPLRRVLLDWDAERERMGRFKERFDARRRGADRRPRDRHQAQRRRPRGRDRRRAPQPAGRRVLLLARRGRDRGRDHVLGVPGGRGAARGRERAARLLRRARRRRVGVGERGGAALGARPRRGRARARRARDRLQPRASSGT